VVSTAYIVALPASSFIPLWRKRRTIRATIGEDKTFEDPGSGMISGVRFLFENYELRAWYWGLVEMSRRVALTSGLILVGQESGSNTGLA
jgi:hypothetical protein